MRWPFVSRGHLDAVAAERDRLAARVSTLEGQQAALMQQLVGMKREGFHPVVVQAEPPRRSEDMLPEEVTDALDHIGLQGRERIQYEQWAQRQLDRGKDAAVIASELIQGGMPRDERADDEGVRG